MKEIDKLISKLCLCDEVTYCKPDDCSKCYDEIKILINEHDKQIIDRVTEKYFDAIEEILQGSDLRLVLQQKLTIYARIMYACNEIAEQIVIGDLNEKN